MKDKDKQHSAQVKTFYELQWKSIEYHLKAINKLKEGMVDLVNESIVLENQNKKLVNAIKAELKRCGGTVPILTEVLKEIKGE